MPVGLQHEHLPNGIEILRLDRPAQRNALNLGLIGALVDALGHLGADPDLRAIVLSTTSTDAFCAGADVNEPLTAGQGVARMDAFAALYAAIEAVPAPTIAVCLGHCVGAGAELAVGCDLRVIADNVCLAWPGARLGVPVGPARLPPLVGLSRAKELIFTGRSIDQAEAVALGLAAAPRPSPTRRPWRSPWPRNWAASHRRGCASSSGCSPTSRPPRLVWPARTRSSPAGSVAAPVSRRAHRPTTPDRARRGQSSPRCRRRNAVWSATARAKISPVPPGQR